MPAVVVAEETIRVGTPTVVEATSPAGCFAAVFEDDGETGYFYGLNLNRGEQPIVDALHVYNVRNVGDADKPSVVRIGWSEDGVAAVLTINGYPHAAFDFERREARCRTGFPPANGTFAETHDWRDEILERFA